MREEVDWFVRLFEVIPGYDKRSDPKGDYGCGGVKLLWALRGPHGAVSCALRTDWTVPSTAEFWLSLFVVNVTRGRREQVSFGLLLPAESAEDCARSKLLEYLRPSVEVEFHSLTEPTSHDAVKCCNGSERNKCWSNGGACWSWFVPKEGSERVRDALIAEGLDGLWRELGALYESSWGDEARAREASCAVVI